MQVKNFATKVNIFLKAKKGNDLFFYFCKEIFKVT